MFLETKTFQLVTGVWALIVGIGVMPFLAGLLVRLSARVNTALFGSHPWQEMGYRVSKIFFATGCVLIAAYGAILLALASAASAGLIKSPWE